MKVTAAYVFADVVPSTIMISLTVWYLCVIAMATYTFIERESTPSADLFWIPFTIAAVLGGTSSGVVQLSFVIFSSPYTIRAHPGWHLSKMLFAGAWSWLCGWLSSVSSRRFCCCYAFGPCSISP